MGNTQKKQQTNNDFIIPHEKFKIVQIVQDTNQMILTIPFEHKNDIAEWQKLLKNVKDCDSEFLLMPKKYLIAEEGLCGSSGLMKIVFDNFTFSFDEQIKNHSEKSKHFQEPEIWYLLFAIISSVKQMDRLSLKVGDIRPYNIFVNQNGQVKLSGVFSWPRQAQNFLKTAFDKTITYLAPQQLTQCRNGQKSKKSHIIGQSFSIGLTLLHTCLLKPMDQLYNIKKYEFDAQKLQSELKQLKNLTFWNEEKQRNQKYSDQLIDIIIRLLNLNQTDRLTSLQLFESLEPHAQQILNLKQFQAPCFTQNTPTKDEPKKFSRYSNQQQISAQYSSIKKKQFVDGQSLGFQISYKVPSSVNANFRYDKNNQKNNTKSVTPQKINKNSQNKNSESPNLQNITIHPRISFGQRKSISKQKYQSNPVVKFNTSAQGQSLNYQPYSNTVYPTNSVNPPNDSKTINYTSNFSTYQSKYEPTQVFEYRNTSQPTPVFFNQGSIDPYIPRQSLGSFIPNPPTTITSSIPFNQNINLATSGYTYIQKNVVQSSTTQNGPSTVTGFTKNTYQTSLVQPVIIGDTMNINGHNTMNLTGNNDPQLDFLKKIDEQLNKSRQLYPSKNS